MLAEKPRSVRLHHPESIGMKGCLVKRFVGNTSSRYFFHILFYNITYLKLLHASKKAVANKWLNETTEVVRTLNVMLNSSAP